MELTVSEKRKSLSELTSEAIERETESLNDLGSYGRSNIAVAIREHLDIWEKGLFPLLRDKKVSRHKYIAELLTKAGYKDVSANYVCTLIGRIRKEKSNAKRI